MYALFLADTLVLYVVELLFSKDERVTVTRWVLLVIVLCAAVLGCSGGQTNEVQKTDLFSLGYGKQEHLLDLYSDNPLVFGTQFSVHYRNGFFYLANAASPKVMVFSSYGDLLQLYYNPETSVPPVSLQQIDSSRRTTKFAVPIDASVVGELTVLENNTLVVVEGVAPQRVVTDAKRGIRLGYQLKLFSVDGDIIQTLGQEGSGGTPFPHIEGIFSLENNGIAVIANFVEEFRIYIFDESFGLEYEILIPIDELPVPFSDNVIPELAHIAPNHEGDKLYLQVHYYQKLLNENRDTIYAIEYRDSSLLEISLASQTYTKEIEIDIDNSEQGLAEFVGISADKKLYFIRYLGAEEIEIIVMDISGRVRTRSIENIGNIIGLYTHITLENDIAALVLRDQEAEVLLWGLGDLLTED